MKHTNKLKEILNVHFNWHKSRIDCFAKMLLAILSVQTVNLSKLAHNFNDKTQITSRYRRLQRFFEKMQIDYNVIAKFIFHLFNFEGKQIYLTMDRTNWKLGKKDINILFLGVVYKKIAIPIYWLVLNKAGNSSANERIALISRFISQFGKECILGILGDREFIGNKWFSWLIQQEIPFYIRIKNNAVTTTRKGLAIDVDGLFYDLTPFESRRIKGKRKIYGCQLYVSGAHAPGKELLIVVSNMQSNRAIETYYNRWQIETLFGCLKTRGFNFESTHITKRNKVKKLVALLAIAFCWAHKIGEWRIEHEAPIVIKKHGRPAKSIFRYGLDLLQDAIAALVTTANRILKLIAILEMEVKPGFL